MKVLAINGSPHNEGGTYQAIKLVAAELESMEIEVEVFHIGTEAIHGCVSCAACRKTGKCVFCDDGVNACAEKLSSCDGLIIGSPVYYAGIAGSMKSFLDRLFFSASQTLRHKVGASVVSVRRAGGVSTFDQLNHYLFLAEMLVAPSIYWSVLHGTNEEQVLNDSEGVQMLQMLGKNMAWLIHSLAVSSKTVSAPESVKRIRTNFIR